MNEQAMDKVKRDRSQRTRNSTTDELYSGGLASFSINRVAEAKPEDIQSVGASNLCLLESFYTCVRNQSQQSFIWALIAAGIGCLFFFFAIASLVLFEGRDISNITSVSLLSGTIIEAIAGLNFYLYGRTSAQLASFHVYLDRTQRFLLANSVCEKIKDADETPIRAEPVRMIAASPMTISDAHITDNIPSSPQKAS